MKKGHSAESAIKCALENDELREYRQIIAINHEGNGHVFSGSKTIDISDYFIEKNSIEIKKRINIKIIRIAKA